MKIAIIIIIATKILARQTKDSFPKTESVLVKVVVLKSLIL